MLTTSKDYRAYRIQRGMLHDFKFMIVGRYKRLDGYHCDASLKQFGISTLNKWVTLDMITPDL